MHFKITLNTYDESLLLENHELNDKHINVSQKLFLHQFLSFQGLKSSLVQAILDFGLTITSKYSTLVHAIG